MGQQGATAALPILAGIGVGAATGNPMIGLTVASAGSSLMAGYQQYQAGQAEADQYKQAAENEKVAGEQRANQIRRDLAMVMGSQEAALAARGVTLGRGGTAETLAREARRTFEEDLRINRYNTSQAASGLNARADQAKIAANSQLFGGVANAAMAGYQGYAAISGLGKVPTTGAKPGGLNARAYSAAGSGGSYSGPKSAFVRR